MTTVSRRMLVAVLGASLLVACRGGDEPDAAATSPSGVSTGDAPGPVATSAEEPPALPTPDETVPDEPDGFGTYAGPGDAFTVDVPSGWGVVVAEGTAVVRPPGDELDTVIFVVHASTDEVDAASAVESLENPPAGEGESVDVPGAVDARRWSGASWAPYEMVVGVGEDGTLVAVTVFDNGSRLTDGEREQVLGSLSFADADA